MGNFTKPAGFFRRTIELHGEIATYHYVFEIAEEDAAFDELQRRRPQIEGEIQEQIDLYFRGEVKVQDIRIKRGSIEIVVVLGTAYAIYLGVSKYKNFIDSLQLMKSQIGRILRRILERYSVQSVQSNTILNPSLPDFNMRSDSDRTLTIILLLYLLVSHAALLGFFIWFVIKKLGT